MKKLERTIRYMDLKIQTVPETKLAQHLDLYAILKNAQTLLRNSQLQRKVRHGAMNHRRLLDIRFTKNRTYAVILFSLADGDTVDTTYETITSGETRSFPKKQGEGTRFTAHLVIRLDNPKRTADCSIYFCLLEETRGLSASAIDGPLKNAIRKAGVGSYNKPDKTEATYEPISVIEGHTSRSLLQELLTGELEGFTLVKNKVKASPEVDESSLLDRRDLQMRLRVVAPLWREKLKEIFAQVIGIAKNDDYDTIRVQFKNEDGRQKTEDFHTEQNKPLESLIVRSKTISLAHPMNYDQKRVDFGFAKRLFELSANEK